WSSLGPGTRGPTNRSASGSSGMAGSGALGSIAHAVGPVGIDIQRPRGALDDLFGDDDLFDAFEARQVEHGVEEDTLHDGAQPARPGLAVDRLAGDGAERLLGESEVDRLHFEQTLVLLHKRVLGLGEDELHRSL